MRRHCWNTIWKNLVAACLGLAAPAMSSDGYDRPITNCLTSVAAAAQLEAPIREQLLEVLARPLHEAGFDPVNLLQIWDDSALLGTSNLLVHQYLRAVNTLPPVSNIVCNDVSLGECRKRILQSLVPSHVFDGIVTRSDFLRELATAQGTLVLTVLLEENTQNHFGYRELIRDLMDHSRLKTLLYTNSEKLLAEFPRV
ncbi:MAG: hypothetical protein KDD51_08850 [Bdellovibrionales bacterium]|nr:hypothetical protein [Bdellovibrionales bacterium]